MPPVTVITTEGHRASSRYGKMWTTVVVFVATSALANAADVAVYFSPDGGATAAVVKEINEAKREILIQAYSFTSVPIASALVAAQKRGLKGEVIAYNLFLISRLTGMYTTTPRATKTS